MIVARGWIKVTISYKGIQRVNRRGDGDHKELRYFTSDCVVNINRNYSAFNVPYYPPTLVQSSHFDRIAGAIESKGSDNGANQETEIKAFLSLPQRHKMTDRPYRNTTGTHTGSNEMHLCINIETEVSWGKVYLVVKWWTLWECLNELLIRIWNLGISSFDGELTPWLFDY